MIAPLRKAHRRTFLALAVLLPAVFLAGLAMRHAQTQVAAAATFSRQSAQGFFTVELRADDVAVAIAPNKHVPDPLLYWVASRPANAELPAGAIFLGRPGAKLEVTRRGYVILYSGAHQRIMDTMELP